MTKNEIANLRELARTVDSRTAFAQKYAREYIKIRRAGDDIADLVFADIPRKRRKDYTVEELEMMAKKYSTRTAWKQDHPAAYRAAGRMGILDVIAPKSLRGKWSRK